MKHLHLVLLLGLSSFCQTADAVVTVSGGQNSTAPPGQPYFNNVGVLGGASAIYLGNGWVMSANHVPGSLPGSVSFGGISYTTQAGRVLLFAGSADAGTQQHHAA
jgi:hypothetical protein